MNSDIGTATPSSHVVQIVRRIGHGGGVSGVAQSLREAFDELGVQNSVVSVDSIPRLARLISQMGNCPRLAKLVEVVAFSILSPLYVMRLPSTHFTISHNDCISGDIFVNHGVHRALIFPKNGKSNWRILFRNPVHIFLLIREHLRYRLHRHLAIVNFSKSGAEEHASYYDLSIFNSAIIPNGVDRRRFGPNPDLRASIRHTLSIPSSAVVAIFVGHEYDRKGLDLALLAMERIDDLHIVVVGGSTQMISRYRSLYQAVDARVHYIGTVESPSRYYTAADYLILPSRQEAWPLVILEGMASGLPALASRTSSLSEVVQHEINGLLVDLTPESVEEAMAMMGDQRIRSRLATSALDRAAEFDWVTIASMYLELSVHLRSSVAKKD